MMGKEAVAVSEVLFQSASFHFSEGTRQPAGKITYLAGAMGSSRD